VASKLFESLHINILNCTLQFTVCCYYEMDLSDQVISQGAVLERIHTYILHVILTSSNIIHLREEGRW
jgi:hypothetical protein